MILFRYKYAKVRPKQVSEKVSWPLRNPLWRHQILMRVHDSVNVLDPFDAVLESICDLLKWCKSFANALLYYGVPLSVTFFCFLSNPINLLLQRFGNNLELGIHPAFVSIPSLDLLNSTPNTRRRRNRTLDFVDLLGVEFLAFPLVVRLFWRFLMLVDVFVSVPIGGVRIKEIFRDSPSNSYLMWTSPMFLRCSFCERYFATCTAVMFRFYTNFDGKGKKNSFSLSLSLDLTQVAIESSKMWLTSK